MSVLHSIERSSSRNVAAKEDPLIESVNPQWEDLQRRQTNRA